MNRWVKKVAVVTGANSGMGAAISASLVKAGVKVVGVDMRTDRIETAAKNLSSENGVLFPIKTDITKEDEIIKTFKVITEKFGGVDILINCAGIMLDPVTSTLSDGIVENWRRIIDTNVLGVCITTREAVRSMKARNVEGHIINISSVAGRKIPAGVGAGLNLYPASKYAVQALSEVLHQELQQDKRKIKVSIIAPGTTETNLIIDKNTGEVIEGFKDLLSTITLLKPQDIADAVLYILGTPPNVLIKDLIIAPIDEIL